MKAPPHCGQLSLSIEFSLCFLECRYVQMLRNEPTPFDSYLDFYGSSLWAPPGSSKPTHPPLTSVRVTLNQDTRYSNYCRFILPLHPPYLDAISICLSMPMSPCHNHPHSLLSHWVEEGMSFSTLHPRLSHLCPALYNPPFSLVSLLPPPSSMGSSGKTTTGGRKLPNLLLVWFQGLSA